MENFKNGSKTNKDQYDYVSSTFFDIGSVLFFLFHFYDLPEKYWKDFTQETEMGTKLHEFIVGDLMNSGNQQPAEQLLKLYTKKVFFIVYFILIFSERRCRTR